MQRFQMSYHCTANKVRTSALIGRNKVILRQNFEIKVYLELIHLEDNLTLEMLMVSVYFPENNERRVFQFYLHTWCECNFIILLFSTFAVVNLYQLIWTKKNGDPFTWSCIDLCPRILMSCFYSTFEGELQKSFWLIRDIYLFINHRDKIYIHF